ncbi:Rrf2 family transcriptional regulator [Chloroflexota bacterium]
MHRVWCAKRIMMDLALYKDSSPITDKCLAEREGIFQNYPAKIMDSLRTTKLVRTECGASGDLILAKLLVLIKLK